jgi:uncharacterized membrane protein YphA (DoxX/SURF4 family)
MNILLWVVQAVLALVFLGTGSMKVIRSREGLRARMAWVEDFPAWAIKAIGAVEIRGAAGLILPAALHLAVVLTPLAAAGLAIVMIGAVATHLRRREYGVMGAPLVLGILAVVVAVLRFGPYHF